MVKTFSHFTVRLLKVSPFVVNCVTAYEGLTCNVAEWVKSTTGANILDENGLATFDNEDAGWILQKMRNWLDNEPYLVPTGEEKKGRIAQTLV